MGQNLIVTGGSFWGVQVRDLLSPDVGLFYRYGFPASIANINPDYVIAADKAVFQIIQEYQVQNYPVQKLSRPDVGQPDAYPNLRAILTKPIDWELVRQQYDQMVKYATAVRLGTAETESILRRFVRSNIQHPTYKAFSELGRAVKTIFLCQYLHSEALRREVNEGLNVVEQWNSANDFIFFARRGEMVSSRREDHEISMLALHLLQNCMVYINTLMLQQVLARPQWSGRLTAREAP